LAEGRLVVNKVSFMPTGLRMPIIKDLSLTIEPGEAVALVGPSGSGKSTLARLIMGILTPTSGEVSLDGIATADWERAQLAHHVGYLPQAVGILEGTILDNIARMQAADPAAAIEAARRAGVHELIGRLAEGYATQVGDAGQALSGGMRQRIALARALYGRPKLLVLDEPNANLDHDGEQTLLKVIREIRQSGAGVLLITHRPAILAAVDRVVTLESGSVSRIDSRATRGPLGAPNLAITQAASAG
jgi:ATP-binding cassette subfamily C protein